MTDDQDIIENKTFGLKRGLWGRIIAIALFVGLGTFAVTQSMVGDRTLKAQSDELAQADAQATDAGDSSSSSEAIAPIDDTSVTSSGVNTFKTTLTDAPATTLQPKQESKSIPTASAGFEKPTPNFSEPPTRPRSLDDFAATKPQVEKPLNASGAPSAFHASSVEQKKETADDSGATESGFSGFNAKLGVDGTPRSNTPGNFSANNPGDARPMIVQSEETKPASQPESSVGAESASTGFANGGFAPRPVGLADSSAQQTPEPIRPIIPPSMRRDINRPNSSANTEIAPSNQVENDLRAGSESLTAPAPRSFSATPSTDLPQTNSQLPDQTKAQETSGQPSGFSIQRPEGEPMVKINETKTPLVAPQVSAQPSPTASATGGTPAAEQAAQSNGFGSGNTSSPTQSHPFARNNAMQDSTPANTLTTPSNNLQTQMPSAARETPVLQTASTSTQPIPGDAKLEGLQTPSLAIEKIAPAEIQLNQTTAFKIAVRNVGRVAAEGVTVVDQIPSGTEFVSAEPAASRRTPDGKIYWDIGHLASGQEQVITLNLKPVLPGEIGSVAQVMFASQASMRTRVTRPILEVEHTGPERSLIGNNVQLRILVHNRGDGEARQVVVQESVPTQLKYNNDEFRDLEYPIGSIPPGQTREVVLNLAAAAAGKFKNTVLATAAGNLKATHQLDLEVVAPQLQSTSDGPSRRFLKREAVYQFATTNNGTASATNVDLVAHLPRGVQFVSANNQGTYNASTNSVYWALSELKPQQTAKVELTVAPVETGQHEINFESTADLNIKNQVKQPLSVEHLVDVYFEIDDVEDHIEVGSKTAYEIRIVNQGTKPASNVRLSVDMESGVAPTQVDSTIQNEIRGQSVVFAPITNLNPGEEVRIVIEGTGVSAGEHRVSANLQTDGREVNITKEESTRVYSDR
ncbi:MAG: hypothetical protein R3C03_15440 [Pirellulaceae bacterium]